MKNIKTLIKFIIPVFAAFFIFFACSLPGNISEPAENTGSGSEKVTLSLSVSSGTRTVNYTVSEIKLYVLYGSLDGGSEQTLGSWTSASDMKVLIDAGNWSFTLAAYDAVSGGNVILEDTKSVNVAASTSLFFTLEPLTSGTGTVDIILNWPSDAGVDSVQAKYAGADVSGDLIKTGTSAEYKNTAAPAGDYILVFKLYDSDGSLAGSTIEKVRVRNNLTSSKTITLSSDDLNAPPAAPSGVSSVSAGDTGSETNASITVTWTDNSKTETAFIIYRNGTAVATVAGGTSSYTDTTAVRGTICTYSVAATNSFGTSSTVAADDPVTAPYLITLYNRDSRSTTTLIEADSDGKIIEPGDPVNSSAESFNGWYTDTGWNTLWDFSGSSVSENTSLYARWNYTVTFDANGGSGTMAPQTIAEGSSANLSANTFTKTGSTFAGWAATSGGPVAYNNQASCTMGSSDVNLYAVWTANTHTITFNANGGSGTMSPQSIAEGESANLNANTFTKTDSTFAGWSTTAGGALIYADKQEYTMGSSDETLYAKWTASKSLLIKLTFDDQNCSDTSGNSYTCTPNNVNFASDNNGGYAASFNGTDSCIELPESILHTVLETEMVTKPTRETFTVMMRFKAEDGQKGVLLGYQNTTVGTQPNQFIPIIMLQSDGKLRCILWTTSNTDITVLSTKTVDDGNWHTVYFSAKSNSIALYLDGEQIGSATGTVAPLSMIYNQIGTSFGRARDPSYSTDAWYYYNGLIDNFYLYNTAMH